MNSPVRKVTDDMVPYRAQEHTPWDRHRARVESYMEQAGVECGYTIWHGLIAEKVPIRGDKNTLVIESVFIDCPLPEGIPTENFIRCVTVRDGKAEPFALPKPEDAA